jgi:predicted YcjX-like family ATPase
MKIDDPQPENSVDELSSVTQAMIESASEDVEFVTMSMDIIAITDVKSLKKRNILTSELEDTEYLDLIKIKIDYLDYLLEQSYSILHAEVIDGSRP